MASNPKVLRFPLKPLYRRNHSVIGKHDICRAISRLDDLACDVEVLKGASENVKKVKSKCKTHLFEDNEGVKSYIELVKALYAARKIARHQYVFNCSIVAEYIHDDRMMKDMQNGKIGEIIDNMKSIERLYGLNDNEYWHTGQAPKEHEELSKQFDAEYDKLFEGVLNEFGLCDLAELWGTKRSDFDQLRERGRRSVHHKTEQISILKDIVVRLEEEARFSALVKLYSGAITLLGSGLEGLLVIRCLQSKHKSMRFARTLPRNKRPSPLDDPTKWNFDALIETCLAAGWLPPISTTIAKYNPASLAHMLREMRNYIHPGRQARENPWAIVGEDDYKVAEAIFIALKATIFKRSELDYRGQQI